MKLKSFLAICLMALVLSACKTPTDVVYFQDVEAGSQLYTNATAQIVVEPGDQLNIIVSTTDQRLTDQFNLSPGSRASTSGSQNYIGYTVDSAGDIDFPMLGKLHVAGMTRAEVAEYIKKQIQEHEYVKDPVVVVNFMNLGLAVLGEVAHPGRIDIKKDKITVLDAIAMAGDLTINGRRENVRIIRSEGDVQKVYTIDMTNAASVYGSPVYYLQQDDVIYVEPNDKTIRNTSVNGNTLQTYGFWISVATLLLSITTLIIR